MLKENYIIKFFRLLLAFLKRTLQNLFRFFNAFNYDEIYLDINFKDVANEFFKSKSEDLEEFCASYTYAKHEKAKLLDNSKSKSKMYKELLDFLKRREQNNNAI